MNALIVDTGVGGNGQLLLFSWLLTIAATAGAFALIRYLLRCLEYRQWWHLGGAVLAETAAIVGAVRLYRDWEAGAVVEENVIFPELTSSLGEIVIVVAIVAGAAIGIQIFRTWRI